MKNRQKSRAELSRELDVIIDSVTDAIGKAVGIKDSSFDMATGTFYTYRQAPDSTELNRLYSEDVLARDLINRIVETGGLPAEKLGLIK